MKLKTGDILFEPLSRNTGEITGIVEGPDGRVVQIRWRPEENHLPHDTEHFYKKVMRCIKNGEFEYTPKFSE